MTPTIEALFIGPTFMAALLIFANPNRVNIKSNRWFGFFVLLIFIIQLEVISYNNHLFGTNTPVYDVMNLANYIIAPVFYFSVVYYVEPDRKWKLTDNLHFLFSFLMLLLTLLSFIIPTNQPETPDEKTLASKAVLIFTLIFCLQVLPYCFFAYYKINKYQKNLLAYSSNIEKVNLNWLKKVVVCVCIIATLWLTDILFQISEKSPVFDSISTVLYFTGICYIAYHALRQKELFPFNSEEKQEIDNIINEREAKPEIKKKLVSDEKLTEYIQSLKDLMNQEKPYLDCEISLIKLAEQFNTSPHLLSYIINTGFEENFFQFINRYRVEEAKRLLIDPKMNHLSLVGIAFEVGFNSKTVFNTTFKKITGQTPTAFKKNNDVLTYKSEL